MTRNDNEWNKECKYNKEHLPTHAILIGSKSCVRRLIPEHPHFTHERDVWCKQCIIECSDYFGGKNGFPN